MGNRVQLSVERLLKTFDQFYEPAANSALPTVVEQSGLKGTITVHRGDLYDGEVAIPYRTTWNGNIFQGVLRFVDDGKIYVGMTQWGHLNSKDGGQFVVALAFGREELKTPFSLEEAKIFEGAKQFYQCRSTQCEQTATKAMAEVWRVRYNEETTRQIQFAEQLVQTVKPEESGFLGWGEPVYTAKNRLNEYLTAIAAIPSDTLEGAALRSTKAKEMILEILKRWGFWECKKIGRCTTVVEKRPDHCHDLEKANPLVAHYLDNKLLWKSGTGGCETDYAVIQQRDRERRESRPNMSKPW